MKKAKLFRKNEHVRIKKNVASTWHGTGRIFSDQTTENEVIRIIRDDGDGTMFQSCHAMPHQISRIKSNQ